MLPKIIEMWDSHSGSLLLLKTICKFCRLQKSPSKSHFGNFKKTKPWSQNYNLINQNRYRVTIVKRSLCLQHLSTQKESLFPCGREPSTGLQKQRPINWDRGWKPFSGSVKRKLWERAKSSKQTIQIQRKKIDIENRKIA